MLLTEVDHEQDSHHATQSLCGAELQTADYLVSDWLVDNIPSGWRQLEPTLLPYYSSCVKLTASKQLYTSLHAYSLRAFPAVIRSMN